jgi:spermidine/putrescine transport system substrate-binding protein
MRGIFIHRFVIRTGIILFWLGSIGFFLLVPRIALYIKPSHTIAILSMPNTINADMFSAFEKKTGISVSISYAETADEIGMKIRTTRGKGYDLIMVADYQIAQLIADGIVQPLQKNKLPFFKNIYPALCDHVFDPGNHYSIPYYWGVYGFGIDSHYFGDKKTFSWKDLFKVSAFNYMVGMRDDIRELVFIAAYYLFGTVHNLTDEQYNAIRDLLIAQKEKVVMYADERIDSLLISRISPLVLTISGDISRVMNNYPYIDFVVPEEGSFVDIDSFVITTHSTHIDDVYLFLNYLYSDPVISYYADLFRLSPPISTVKTCAKIPLLAYPTEELFSHLKFFATVIPQSRINAILTALKSA